MTENASHIRFRRRFFQLGFLFFFLLAVGIFAGQLRETALTFRIEEADLEGVTPTELFEFREKNPSLFLPPQNIEKSREIVRQSEELWIELQKFKNESKKQ